ncbi:MAG: hypothetical protein ABI744_07440 [Chloroflexota bacterium]
MTDEHTPEEELEIDGEDQDSGHDGAPMGDQAEDEDLDDELAEQEEEEEQERDEGPRSGAKLPPVRGALSDKKAAAAARTAVVHSDDELPYIDDRASKIWVAAIVAVFALILAYGLLFGKSGALTPPTPSPEPTPTAAPSATATPVPSASLTAAPSVTITPSASHTGGAPPTPTPAPSQTAAPSSS